MGNNCLGRSVADEPIFMPEDAERLQHVTLGQDIGLTNEPVVWQSSIPLTEGQLRGKRDTFWETAPIYDGRKEIWDALKAAAEAAEENEYELARAILSGAGISLPLGRLTEAYDELGNRYVIPPYCLSRPVNMQEEGGDDEPSSEDQLLPTGNPVTLKIRVSSLGRDIRLKVLSTDSILDVKKKLEAAHGVPHSKVTMLFSGRIVLDKTVVQNLNIPKGFLIQAIVS